MLYLHIPYCHRKCTYCAFYSSVTSGNKQAYVDALCKELVSRRSELPHPLRTVYWGGGTPTILTLAQISQIVGTIRSHYHTSQVEEVTIEANPEDLTPEFLNGLRDLHFFNRISIGIQSFCDSDLKMLNRRHNAQQALDAVHNAKAAGFDNISVDLIYGLPQQTLPQWLDNLHQLEQLPITHLSAYSLTVEEGTMLHLQIAQGRISPTNDDEAVAQYDALLLWAKSHDFEQYEISNFCRSGCRSKHNSRYWVRTPYLGVGAAAHSFDGNSRRWNVADAEAYIANVTNGHTYHESETLTPRDAYNEYIMTSLRTIDGIDKSQIPANFRSHFLNTIQPFLADRLLEETETHFKPTPDGLLYADGVAAELFLD